jgi:hypothetical protein
VEADHNERVAAEWELLIEEAVREAEERVAKEEARKRTVQIAREQAYLRLAMAIDAPQRRGPGKGQLSFFPQPPTLFDED